MLLLCSTSLYATESEQQPEKTTPLSLCASFERFIENFVGLFKKDSFVEGMESLEEMTTNLLKTAFGIMGSKIKPPLYNDESKRVSFHDEQLEDHLANVIAHHAQTIAITRKAPIASKKDDEEENQAKILSLFAGIVKNFFTIVQDPENKDNVLPNLMNMAAGIVEIGGEVIRNGNLRLDATEQEINAYVTQLDNATKQAMLNIIKQKADELWGKPCEL